MPRANHRQPWLAQQFLVPRIEQHERRRLFEPLAITPWIIRICPRQWMNTQARQALKLNGQTSAARQQTLQALGFHLS